MSTKSADYELKVGARPVYDVILDKKGRIIDGVHRLDEKPDWPKRVLEDIDDDYKFWTMKAVLLKARQVPYEEKRQVINNLAIEVLKKDGPKNLVEKIHDLTGWRVNFIQEALDDKFKKPVKARPPASKRETKPEAAPRPAPEADEDEEGEGEGEEKVETPKVPPRDTQQYADFVADFIGQNLGEDYEDLVTKVGMVCKLTPEEAKLAVDGFRQTNRDVWGKVYSPQNVIRKPASVAAPPEEEQRQRVYFRDAELEQCMRFLPDALIDRLWDAAPNPERRIPFFKAFFTVACEEALTVTSFEDLVKRASSA